MIQLSHITVKREGSTAPVLVGLDLKIATGESCALLGANGAGKSTLMLSLVGLEPIVGGRAEICGLEVVKSNLRKIRAIVGLVFQNSDDQLFCQTIEDDVAFGLENLGLKPHEAHIKTREYLEKFAIVHLKNRSANELSEGEKKRAAICTIAAMNPQVMMLDEPSAQLDPRGKRQLAKLLNTLTQTKLVSTHDMQFAENVCQTAAVLENGRVAAYGEIGKILADKKLLERCGLA